MEPRAPGSWLSGALQAALYLAYPLVVWFGHARLEPRQLALCLLGVYALSLLLRARGRAADWWALARPHLPLLALFALAAVVRDRQLLLFMPALASLGLFAVFAWSLHRGPPLIERFARAIEYDLPAFTHPYCRKVTGVWCGFLLAHAVAVCALARFAPLAWWAVYTGVIFYALLGLLFAVEFAVRKIWFRYYGSGPADRVFARLFPPERTHNGRRSLAYRRLHPRPAASGAAGRARGD